MLGDIEPSLINEFLSETSELLEQLDMDLLALEAPERGSLRDSMVRAFNSSFTRMRERYRRCTDEVRDEEVADAAEGRDLANRMAASYFPKPG